MTTLKPKITLPVVVAVIALTGCSHSNPLNQYSNKTVADDLLSSAVRAEMYLGIAKKAYQAGYYYSGCMDGKNPEKTCNAIYQAMQHNLKTKYKSLSTSDIRDKKLWSFVKGYYQEDMFNRLSE